MRQIERLANGRLAAIVRSYQHAQAPWKRALDLISRAGAEAVDGDLANKDVYAPWRLQRFATSTVFDSPCVANRLFCQD